MTTVNFIQVGDDFSGITFNTKLSYNGIVWLPSTNNPFSLLGLSVAYGLNAIGNSRWVMGGVDSSSYSIKYSDDDGANWSNATNPFSGTYNSCYGINWGKDNNNNNLWVAVGGDDSGHTIKHSTDGSLWSNATNGFYGGSIGSGYGNGVSWGKDNNNNNLWVAVGHDDLGNTIKYSTDGSNWSNATTTPFHNNNGRGVSYGNLWVALGEGDGVGNNSIKYSTDGITWSNANNGFDLYGNSASFGKDNNGDNLWVAVGDDNLGNTIKYSTDGITWSNANNGFPGGSNDVTWGEDNNGDNLWVAVGGNGDTLTTKYSTDGINWIDTTDGTLHGSGIGVASRYHHWLPPPTPPPPPVPPPPISNRPGPIQYCTSRFAKCNITKKTSFSSGNVTIQGTTNARRQSLIVNQSTYRHGAKLVFSNQVLNAYGRTAGGPGGFGAPPRNHF